MPANFLENYTINLAATHGAIQLARVAYTAKILTHLAWPSDNPLVVIRLQTLKFAKTTLLNSQSEQLPKIAPYTCLRLRLCGAKLIKVPHC